MWRCPHGRNIHNHTAGPAPHGWSLTADANVFFGINHQDRRFRDFTAWESQNWLMGQAEYRRGPRRVILTSMWSLEPWTLRDRGSPQVFQTGETFEGAPLKDYQHPHDLAMALGARFTQALSGGEVITEAALVGAPVLAPLRSCTARLPRATRRCRCRTTGWTRLTSRPAW